MPLPRDEHLKARDPARWDTRLAQVSSILNAIAAIIAATAALLGVVWFLGLPPQHIDSRSPWKVHEGDSPSWKGSGFDDASWAFAVGLDPGATVFGESVVRVGLVEWEAGIRVTRFIAGEAERVNVDEG